MNDFFLSYTFPDEAWAEWLAWTLEAAGFSTVIQKWDFRPGGNFILEMQRAAADCKRTVAVLSPNYLQSAYGAPEWAAAFAADPKGSARALVPVRVADCKPEGLLKAIVYIDLLGFDEEHARQVLLNGVAERRAKPSFKPEFPGTKSASRAPVFPGRGGVAAPGLHSPIGYMPRIGDAPSDLEKRRFLKGAYEVIRHGFEERLGQLVRGNAGIEFDLTLVDATKL